jgi:hypothetical protein
LGRSNFARPTPGRPRRFVAETKEERLWRRGLPGLFAPERATALTKLVNHIGVTPLAHVTLLNLDYQIYLNKILHTSAGTWLGHVVLIPINVGLLFYALAIYAPFSGGGFALNGGLVLLVLLTTWYAAMAARLRNPLWGGVVLAVLAGLWLLANECARLATSAGAELPIYFSPILLMLAVSLLLSASHLFERNVPPRANFERGWKPVHEFVWGDSEPLPLPRRVLRLAWTPIGATWGTIDEWWASTKLLPLYVLEIMWACGYKREQRDRHRATSLLALASGDPALDWVGVGGGASVRELGEPDPRHA